MFLFICQSIATDVCVVAGWADEWIPTKLTANFWFWVAYIPFDQNSRTLRALINCCYRAVNRTPMMQASDFWSEQ